MRLRERIGSWIAGQPLQRASPIPVTPEWQNTVGGGVLFGPNPAAHQVLEARNGIPELAMRAIANRVSQVKWITKRSVQVDAETVEDEIIDDHPLTRLLERPHPDFSGRQFFRLIGEAIALYGEAYAYKVTNSFGRAATLQIQQIGETWPIVRNGEVVAYGHRDGKGAQRTLRKEDLVRFWFPELGTIYSSRGYFGPNYLYNDSLHFQGEHMRNHWRNDAIPKVILKAADQMVQQPGKESWAKFQAAWRNAYHQRTGTKQGLPAMLPSGWDVVMVAAESGSDVTPLLEWLEQQQLMNYGVPNALLGKVKSGDRSSAETTAWIFDVYSITPIVDMIRDALNQHLVSDFSDDVWVDYEPFVAPDKEFDLRQSVELLGAKVVSPNEVRTDAGRDEASWGELPVGTFGDQPYTGERTDDPFTPEDESAQNPPDEDAPEDPEEEERKLARYSVQQAFSPQRQWAYRRQVESRWLRRMQARVNQVFRIQEAMALEAFRRRARAIGDDLFDEAEWGLLWEQLVEPVRRAVYRTVGQQTLNLLSSGDFDFTASVVQELRRQGASLVTNANSTTIQALREQLIEGADQGESVNRLEQRIQEVFQGRRRNARTIARTELLMATENAQQESFQQSGVVERKRWNSSRDGAVRDTHVESAIPVVPLNQPFTLPDGEQGMYPGDRTLSAHNVINCRCFVTPVFEGEV